MNTMRFAIERLLRTVGQDVLDEFAGCFRDEWAKRQLPCPVNGMERRERESTWTRMVLGTEDPPHEMVDALLGAPALHKARAPGAVAPTRCAPRARKGPRGLAQHPIQWKTGSLNLADNWCNTDYGATDSESNNERH